MVYAHKAHDHTDMELLSEWLSEPFVGALVWTSNRMRGESTPTLRPYSRCPERLIDST